jgi:hypothetical protein
MSIASTKSESNRDTWRQFSLRSLLLLVLACALLFWWLQPPRLDRGYFPMKIGDRWVYEYKGNSDVVFEVIGTEKLGDAECFVVLRTIGEHEIRFYVEVTDRAVLIHQVGDDRYTPAYPQFEFNSRQGNRWGWQGTIGNEPSEYACENLGIKEVRVPKGLFDAFAVSQKSESSTTFWLARGIGVVRIEGKSRDQHDPHAAPGELNFFDWQLKVLSRKSP